MKLYDKERIDWKNILFDNRALFWLLLPIIIEQFLNSLMGMVDTMMVSTVGSDALSAVALVNSINNLVIQIFAAMAAGATIICSQYIGGGNKKESNKAAEQVVLTVSVISLAITVFCLFGGERLLRLIFGTVEDSVMENSLIYFMITVISYPFLALFSAGAAFATLLSRVFCTVVVYYCLRQPKQTIVVRNYLKIRPDMPLILTIMAIGVPAGIENGMFQFGKLAIQSTVSTMGTVVISAQAMTDTFEMVNGIFSNSVGIGLMTVVGQCIGARRMEEAKYYIVKLMGIAWIGVLVSCLLVLAVTKPVTWISGMEPEAAELCF